MAGMSTGNSSYLIRSNLWSQQLKDVLYADLMGSGHVRWLTDFPDGTTINIPSVGQMVANDYVEDQAVEYTSLDTGNFQLTISEYVSSATYITNKVKQDAYLMSQIVGMFVPKMSRALAERLEQDIFKVGQPGSSNGQTVADLNLINGQPHRWVGSNTINTSYKTIGPADFARANLALDKAFVPVANRIAIVDPSVAYALDTLTNIVNVQNNPKWEGVIAEGLSSGMRFTKHIFGFDVYVSNFLPLCGTNQSGTAETINGVASDTNARVNLFFSAMQDVNPFVGAWRQMPKVDAEYNKDFQREEYVVTSRYGLKLFRPENFISVLSCDPAHVA